MHKVFVYGTLKKGHGNHDFLLQGSKFIGEFTTKEKYNMKDGGFPYVCRKGETMFPIRGEVYEVNDDTLQSLDWLEGIPSHYQRMPVEIDGLEGVEMYSIEQAEGREDCPIVDGAFQWR